LLAALAVVAAALVAAGVDAGVDVGVAPAGLGVDAGDIMLGDMPVGDIITGDPDDAGLEDMPGDVDIPGDVDMPGDADMPGDVDMLMAGALATAPVGGEAADVFGVMAPGAIAPGAIAPGAIAAGETVPIWDWGIGLPTGVNAPLLVGLMMGWPLPVAVPTCWVHAASEYRGVLAGSDPMLLTALQLCSRWRPWTTVLAKSVPVVTLCTEQALGPLQLPVLIKTLPLFTLLLLLMLPLLMLPLLTAVFPLLTVFPPPPLPPA
jgi:hypothetical protein